MLSCCCADACGITTSSEHVGTVISSCGRPPTCRLTVVMHAAYSCLPRCNLLPHMRCPACHYCKTSAGMLRARPSPAALFGVQEQHSAELHSSLLQHSPRDSHDQLRATCCASHDVIVAMQRCRAGTVLCEPPRRVPMERTMQGSNFQAKQPQNRKFQNR